MFARRLLLAMSCLAVLGLGTASSLDAQANASRMMYLTFSQPVQLPDVSLRAGTYIFELADPTEAWDVVRVSSRNRKTVYFASSTKLVDRPAGMRPDQRVSFAEAPRNSPRPIMVWYPSHELKGRQFVYRAHP